LAAVDDVGELAQVIIVENGPVAELEGVTLEFCELLPIKYRYTSAANKSLALNLGLQHAPDGLIILLDDDIRIATDLVSAYRAAMMETPCGAYFGGPFAVDYEVVPDATLLPYMTGSTKGWTLANEDQWVARGTHFLGFNWAALRSDLLAIGGFDPNHGPGSPTGATGQESDAQRRLAARGLRGRYVWRAKAWHRVTEDQITPDWILSRRRRAGVELGQIISARYPRWARRIALGVALVLLRLRFRRRNRCSPTLKSYHQNWWTAYKEGARSVT
jgi:glycosyltransferase involved in cell wall biosynthesis